MSDTRTKAPPNTLYETDFFAWTQEQAQLLRARRFDDLDLDNLVDEVESVGSSEKREIRNRLKGLITHLLKWKYQPARRGTSWRRTIKSHREILADIVQSSPSLRPYLLHAISAAHQGATVDASEETGLAAGVFPDECPFSAIEILDLGFFPEDPSFE
jgi:hypothetical protein